jgi:(p)ppGpp synthase/HD superfamily hydrolase
MEVTATMANDTVIDPPLTDLRRHGYARTWPQLSNQLIAMLLPVDEIKKIHAAYSLSVDLFGSMVRANEAPFLSHTVGTASILAVHGAPTNIVCGGLLHAAYTHGTYETPPDRPLNKQHRVAIAQAVSPEVELLARNYRRYRPAELPVPADAGAYDEDHASVLLIRAANHLEEYLDCGLIYANKTQKQGQEVMQHSRVLLPALGYHRLLAEMEAAEKLMADMGPSDRIQVSAGSASRRVAEQSAGTR